VVKIVSLQWLLSGATGAPFYACCFRVESRVSACRVSSYPTPKKPTNWAWRRGVRDTMPPPRTASPNHPHATFTRPHPKEAHALRLTSVALRLMSVRPRLQLKQLLQHAPFGPRASTRVLRPYCFNMRASTLLLQHARFDPTASTRALQPYCFNACASTVLLQHARFDPTASTRALRPYCFNTRFDVERWLTLAEGDLPGCSAVAALPGHLPLCTCTQPRRLLIAASPRSSCPLPVRTALTQ
jgi:hypothetical protein